MLNEILTVARKEILELAGKRGASRGPLIQAAVVMLVAGVLLPANPKAFSAPSAAILFYSLFASTLSANVAADAFAGERERKTLETLLSTPLPAQAIVIGKVATAVLFAMTTIVASLVLAVVTLNLRSVSGGLFLPPPELFATALAGALGASLVTSGLAIAVSIRIPVARSAQQIASLGSMLIGGALAVAINSLHLQLTWGVLLRIDLVLFALGIFSVRMAARSFHRERFFEAR